MIYWINLEESTDRKQFMQQQLSNHKYPNQRISAIKPSQTPVVSKQKRITKGEYGCLLSHCKCLQKIVTSNESYGIVMEDDIIMPFKVNFQKIIQSAPTDWEILQLFVIQPTQLTKLLQSYQEGILWEPWSYCNFSTGIYIINKKGAQKLLQTLEYNESKINTDKFLYKAQADQVLYRNAITYTFTYPLYYSKISFGSLIHNGHLVKHEKANDLIRVFQKKHSVPSIVCP